MAKKTFYILFFCSFSVFLWAGITGDFDLSGRVDVNDLLILSQQWLESPAMPSADIAPDPNDGFVDLLDFAEFSTHWLATLPDSNEMVFIPGGQFQMGDSLNDGTYKELPVHTVILDQFYIGKYEVTNSQFCAFLNDAIDSNSIYIDGSVIKGVGNNNMYCGTYENGNPSQLLFIDSEFVVLDKDGRDMTNDPMVSVMWYGAAAYCNWRSEKAGYQTCYDLSTWECDFTKKGYRLPTEAEWEFAARGGQEAGRFPWFDPNTISHDLANYSADPNNPVYDVSDTTGYHPDWGTGNEQFTNPVGTFTPNGYGLYDIAGNAEEWCNDWASNDYSNSSSNNPTGPESGSARILRGGSWNSSADDCRVAHRYAFPPERGVKPGFGFRICLDLE